MKWNLGVMSLVVLSLAGFGVDARAQGAVDVVATPLFDSTSFKVGMLIPFRLTGPAVDAAEGISAQVLDVESGKCQIMPDPHLTSVFHLKCVSEAETRIVFTVVNGASKKTLFFGPVRVTPFVATYGAPLATPTPSPQDLEKLALEGKKLWVSYCATCHTDPKAKQGRTAAIIKAMINNTAATNSMKTLKGLLSDADLKKIEAYLVDPAKY
jgi:cytochrome c553